MRVEHAFAALKGRFQCLRELRHPLQNDEQLKYHSYWIMCCLILHNMIIRFEEQRGISSGRGGTENWALRTEGSDLIPPEQEEDFDIDEVGDTSSEGTTGHQACAQLMEYLLR